MTLFIYPRLVEKIKIKRYQIRVREIYHSSRETEWGKKEGNVFRNDGFTGWLLPLEQLPHRTLTLAVKPLQHPNRVHVQAVAATNAISLQPATDKSNYTSRLAASAEP